MLERMVQFFDERTAMNRRYRQILFDFLIACAAVLAIAAFAFTFFGRPARGADYPPEQLCSLLYGANPNSPGARQMEFNCRMAIPLPPLPTRRMPDAMDQINPSNGITREEIEAAMVDWCSHNPQAPLCIKLERRR